MVAEFQKVVEATRTGKWFAFGSDRSPWPDESLGKTPDPFRDADSFVASKAAAEQLQAELEQMAAVAEAVVMSNPAGIGKRVRSISARVGKIRSWPFLRCCFRPVFRSTRALLVTAVDTIRELRHLLVRESLEATTGQKWGDALCSARKRLSSLRDFNDENEKGPKKRPVSQSPRFRWGNPSPERGHAFTLARSPLKID